MSEHLDQVLSRLETQFDAATQRLCDVLRIPSISADPAHAGDCRAAVVWFRDQFAAMGFTAEVHETAGHPALIASHPGPANPASAGAVPHLLYYGHYDVQPPDPLELWHSPPFAPVLRQGRHGTQVVARGAVDDKGQVMMWLEALRAWCALGGPPCRVTVIIEGEEEIGSPSLAPLIAAQKAALSADVVVISDTGMWDIDTPAVTTRLRGLAYVQVDLFGPNRDLHSGLFGGSALNPITALARMLAELHDANGRVTLPGFYDQVRPVPQDVALQWAGLGFDEAEFLAQVGLVPGGAGERGTPALQRLWARPTAELNGIWGGYTGPGSKTVIPAEAHAKLSFRLVPDQEPEAVVTSLKQFLAARLPPGARVEVQEFSSARGISVPEDSAAVRAAQAALAEEYGRPAILIGSGGSIPVVESFHRILGIDSLLMGFGLDDDAVHSPNEKFEMRCFRHGMRAHARLLEKIR
jgi:acetylornithine deacetylase/succinyl-diaminopimelate desuccinylase-like protein